MDSTEIKKILRLCKEFNIKTIKTGSLDISFFEPQVSELEKSVPTLPVVSTVQKLEVQVDPNHPLATMPSDDEMLMYSTPYFEQMKSEREQ